MNVQQAIDALRDAATHTTDMRAMNTYDDLAYELIRSPTEQAKLWLPKTKSVIAHVGSGHFAGSTDDARRLWNRQYKEEDHLLEDHAS